MIQFSSKTMPTNNTDYLPCKSYNYNLSIITLYHATTLTAAQLKIHLIMKYCISSITYFANHFRLTVLQLSWTDRKLQKFSCEIIIILIGPCDMISCRYGTANVFSESH